MTTSLGYTGLVAFALAWIPQSWETIRDGRCGANRAFLSLSALGSLSLACYAFRRGDAVFSSLNALTSVGAGINIWFSVFPRPWAARAEALHRPGR
jgi:lipid-A-disaccharide synthase-like uncharacterized protein